MVSYPQSQSKFPLIVTSLFVFLLIFVAGYKLIQTLQTSPTLQTDQSVNWKTYTNEEFNFSLKYPSSLVDIGESENDLTISYPGPSDQPLFSVNFYRTNLAPQVWWKQNGETLYAWLFNTAFNRIEISEPGELKGLEAIEVVGQRRSPGGATLSSSIILLPHNDDLFVIYGADSDGVYKKILSTFTFLDQSN